MSELQLGTVIRGDRVDATAHRERLRQRRLLRVAVIVVVPVLYVWFRELRGDPVHPRVPNPFAHDPVVMVSVALMMMLMLVIMLPLVAAGRSPHVLLRPSDSTVGLVDVVGAGPTRREAID